jgi:DUF1680 family protein
MPVLSTTGAAGPVGATAHGVSATLPFGATRITDGFLARALDRNARKTIPHCIAKLEEVHNLRNLRRLTGESDDPFAGYIFQDSDIYKALEAVAWQLGRADDDELRAFYFNTVDLLERAQREDGYLDSAFQLEEGTKVPWSDFEHGHELYVLGHLIQAAIAGRRAIGDERLLGVAQRWVALVDTLFGGADSPVVCGHPEIEMALIELHRLTGDEAALRLGQAMLTRRGHRFVGSGMFGAQYFQDDTPILDTHIMRGHAVRALYLNSGATDLYLETGSHAWLDAMTTQWRDLVDKRMYITGGTGSRHRDEAFGDAYELPSDRSYSETCAGIALMQWAWRMYLATGAAHYLDEFERAFYNVVLDGVAESGTEFFYSNPLQLRANHVGSQQESAGRRLPWYKCACCPPNLARTLASFEHYVAASRGEELQIANYASADIRVGDVSVALRTGFPVDGAVSVEVAQTSAPARLAFRVPAWAGAVTLTRDGQPVPATQADGWLRPVDALAPGVVVLLTLEMPVRVWQGHPNADAIRDCVAITRGPLVYCADQADNAVPIEDAALGPAAPAETDTIVGGLGPALHATATQRDLAGLALYSPAGSAAAPTSTATLVLRPYALWGQGDEPGAMRVWIPQAHATR